MKFLTLSIATLIFVSCSNNPNVIKYNRIINEGDTFKIYQRVNDGLVLKKTIYQPVYLRSLKSILTRHIISEYQEKFIANAKIEIYKGNIMTGALLIATSKEHLFANFNTEDFGFSFKLTYGIGMYLDGSE